MSSMPDIGDVARPADEPAIQVRSLTLRAGGRRIVNDVSLSVSGGQVCSIVGESGSGKTSLALAMLGFLRRGVSVEGGSITVLGHDVTHSTSAELQRLRGNTIAYMPQDPAAALNPALRVGRALSIICRKKLGLNGVEEQRRVHDGLVRVDLPTTPDFLRRYPHQLSGGQQQRLALAIATLADPRVLIMDEPTTGLDALTEKRVLGQVLRLNAEAGMTIVYITHDLRVARELSSHIAVMYSGRLMESGPARPLLSAPRHPYTSALLKAAPTEPLRRRLVPIRAGRTSTNNQPGCPFAPRCDSAIATCQEEHPPTVDDPGATSYACHNPVSRSAAFELGAQVLDRDSTGRPVVLSIEHLIKHFWRRDGALERVLADVSLEVREGERVGLLGLSGSGKTTLLRCVAGLAEPDQGTIRIRQKPLPSPLAKRSREQLSAIGYVFQNPYDSLNPKRTIGRTLGSVCRQFKGLTGVEQETEVHRLLDLVHLQPHHADSYPGQLSGGERQRAAIAAALASEPDILLCDEVTSALDVSVRAAIIELLRELSETVGMAVLFVTHDLTALTSLCDQHYVIESGVVTQSGPIDDLLHRPTSSLGKSLVAAYQAPENDIAESLEVSS